MLIPALFEKTQASKMIIAQASDSNMHVVVGSFRQRISAFSVGCI